MSSDLCPISCSVPATTFSTTLTSGIQDISALLPLLGTDQCEEHVSSALTNGYLYAAASPISLFGSLGLARAGFKTFFAGINFSIRKWNFHGAQTLSNMGFQPQGVNLSLIMADQERKGRYVAESRLARFLEGLPPDKIETRGLLRDTNKWNLSMIALTAFTSSVSILPYVYLNTRAGSSLSPLLRWLFPSLRAAGGFLTMTMMQLVIQKRITSIIENMLLERGRRRNNRGSNMVDGSAIGGSRGPMRHTTDGLTWVFLFLLLLGALASVVGYVGCFSVVQSARKSLGPLSWLIMEGGLSLIRMILWGLNPEADDAPSLEFILALDGRPPLPTCNRNDDHIQEDKVLPLTQARYFLNSITSFAGLIKHFDWPGLTLYYTLTRAGPHPSHDNATQRRFPNERVLYITIFDYKERTARTFTRFGNVNRFYSATVSVFHPEQGLLEARLGEVDSTNNPIAGDDGARALLENHYQSLLQALNRRQNHEYRIGNAWMMKPLDATPMLDVEAGTGDVGDDCLARDVQYFEQGRFGRLRQSLDDKRGRWVESYMRLVIVATRGAFEGDKALVKKLDGVLVEDHEVQANMESDEAETLEWALMHERLGMEMLLVYEVEEWEGKLWNVTQEFIHRADVQEKERVALECKENCSKRLEANIRAMEARMEAAKASTKLAGTWQYALRYIQTSWRSVTIRMDRLISGSVDPSAMRQPQPPLALLTLNREHLTQVLRVVGRPNYPHNLDRHQQSRLSSQQNEMERRLCTELEDIESRLRRGLETCDEFCDEEWLVQCRHFRSKWLSIPHHRAPVVYSRSLRARDDLIYVSFFECEDDGWVADTIRNMPYLTSVSIRTRSLQLGDIHQRKTPLFIDAPDADIADFLEQNKSRFEETDRTFIYINNKFKPSFTGPAAQLGLTPPATIAISFVGPVSGNLTLSLKHYAPSATLVIVGTRGSPPVEHPIPPMLTVDDITLHPHPAPSHRIPFKRSTRNNLIIQVSPSSSEYEPYHLQDIQLLEGGHAYNPSSSGAPGASQGSSSGPDRGHQDGSQYP